jgi:glucosamine-6-phosphate deaminase
MSNVNLMRSFRVEKAAVQIFPNKEELWRAVAVQAISVLRDAISNKAHARIIVATGNSQDGVVEGLVEARGVDWLRVEVFHMDEYVNLPATHQTSFRRWLKTRLVDLVHPGQVHYLNGDASKVTLAAA